MKQLGKQLGWIGFVLLTMTATPAQAGIPKKSFKFPPVLQTPKVGAAAKQAFCNSFVKMFDDYQNVINTSPCYASYYTSTQKAPQLKFWCMKASVSNVQTRLKMIYLKMKQCREAHCKLYASTTNKQQKINIAYQCGQAGPVWSKGSSSLYSWCINAPHYDSVANFKTQKQKIDTCVYKKTLICKNVLKGIASQQQNNKTYACNVPYPFSGMSLFKCVTIKSSLILKQVFDFSQKVIACKAQKTALCNKYKTNVINAKKTNLKNLCGYKGDIWQSSEMDQYNWCLKTPSSVVALKIKGINAMITSCLSRRHH